MRPLFRSLLILICLYSTAKCQYDPNWASLDTRPIPEWYDKAKVGIFIHWGVFSVPSFGSEWFWADWKSGDAAFEEFINRTQPPGFTYQEYAKEFTAEFYNATEWASLFAASGAKYVVLTSKHHEGFTLWPSKYAFSWNAKDVGPRRDVLGELATAVRDADLTFGLYHSLYEWYNPIYNSDKNNNFTTQEFVLNKIIPEMKELIENYKPAVLWSDGDWEAKDVYWNATEFLAYLYNESPVKEVVVANDRWGSGIPCNHGDFYTCSDRYNPGVLQKHKWENAMTLDKRSWGYRRNAPVTDYFSINELITTMAQTVSCGGNILINVGPTKDGIIAPIFQDRLLALGDWLSINGEAIYETTPWTTQNDTFSGDVWYTSKGEVIYAIVLQWPLGNILTLGSAPQTDHTAVLLDKQKPIALSATPGQNVLLVKFPDKSVVSSNVAWVVKFTPSKYHVNLI